MLHSFTSRPRSGPGHHPGAALALASLCLSVLLVVMDNTIVNVALPTLATGLGASTSTLQWIVDAYTLAFSCLLLPAGHIGDQLGRRRVLTISMVLFGAMSAACALSGGVEVLIGLRVVFGMSAAGIYPATLALVMTAFTEPRRRSLAVGLWAATSGVGIALGPVLGGLLLERFSWASIFWINVPLAALAVLAVRLSVPESRGARGGRLDVVGSLLAVLAIGQLVWAIIESSERGWDDPLIRAAGAGAALGLVGLICWERHCTHPVLDLSLFTRRAFSVGSASIAVVFFALFGFIFVFTQYFQAIRGYSTLQAGLATLPFAAVMAGLSPFSSALGRRLGPSGVVGSGMILMGTGFCLATRLRADSSYWGFIVPAMMLMAAGMALVQAPATSAIMSVAPARQMSAASAVNDTTRQIGGTLGVALVGSVLGQHFASGVDPTLASLPLSETARSTARGSASAAMAVAGQLPEGARQVLEEATRAAFTDAARLSSWVVAGACLAGAIVALIGLPARDATSDTGSPGAGRPEQTRVPGNEEDAGDRQLVAGGITG